MTKKIQRNEILGRYDMSFSNGGSNKTETFTCENIQQVEINATDIVHIRIYYNEGLIEKHVPKVIKEEYKNKYKYIYHDKDGNEHEIGIYEHNDKKLVNLDDFNGFSSGGINIAIKIKSGNEDRCYISTINFSALIGALAEIDASDICTTQFSTSDGGSPPPSVSHSNGIAGDLRYLSTNRDGAATYLQHNHFDYTRNVALTNALYKFGFGKAKSMLSEYFDRNGTQTLLPHTVHFRTEKVRHHHHLHLQGLDPNYQEIKE